MQTGLAAARIAELESQNSELRDLVSSLLKLIPHGPPLTKTDVDRAEQRLRQMYPDEFK